MAKPKRTPPPSRSYYGGPMMVTMPNGVEVHPWRVLDYIAQQGNPDQ